jgi:DNA-binding TFAR19-related protein (PDSD5 family)
MDPQSLERLGNIRAANPMQAEKVEAMLLYLFQSGQIKDRIPDELFKQILGKLSARRDTRITRK